MTPKTAVLHIGTPKTGTTSIQRCLADAQANGQLAHVCFPLWKNDLNHNRLAALYLPHEELPLYMQRSYPAGGPSLRNMRRRYRRFLFEELSSASAAVISSEFLGVSFSAQHAARLRADLESAGFRQFHVLLYIRDPADYYLSGSQQCLRISFEPPFVRDPALFKYGFLRAAQAWEQTFPGRLIVRAYRTQADQDVLDDFRALVTQLLGIVLPPIPLRMNTSLSAEGMQIMQDYRQLHWSDNGGVMTPDSVNLARFLAASGKDLPQTKPVLKDGVAHEIRVRHKADADLIYSRYGVDLGLRELGPSTLVPRKSYQVEDILETVDPEIVQQLLLRLARAELGRHLVKRPLPMRAAVRAYRTIPPARRPKRVDAVLRSIAGMPTP